MPEKSQELAGISLSRFIDPVRESLKRYENNSHGFLMFDAEKAGKLELTPDKPNSARTATPVNYLNDYIGTLYVIAFRPGDGTGDEKTYSLAI